MPSQVTDIKVSTGDLMPAFSTSVFDYEITSLTTMIPVSITVSGQDTIVAGSPAKDGVPLDVKVPALDDNTSIQISAHDLSGQPVTYTLHTVPQKRAYYDVTTLDSPEPGNILVTPIQTGGWTYVYILDETGRLLFYKLLPRGAFDFQRFTMSDDTKRYAYIMVDGAPDPKLWPIEPSTVYVLDDHFRPMQTIQLAAAGNHPAGGVDVHDFKLIADDHWIVQGYLGETVTNVPNYASSGVVSAVVQEVNAGQVVFDWETTSVPALYTQSTDGNDFSNATKQYADYNHLNAVTLDPSNGNVVVSLRHDDEVVELDHTTGQIVWTLGGVGDDFGLASADKSSHQHHARFLGPNHLLMFDNGNASQLTKIREYQIDPVGHTAQALAAMSVDGHYSSAMGSVQKINGKYFVGWGYRRSTESDVTELDATTGKKSFELSFHDSYFSYRALKYQ